MLASIDSSNADDDGDSDDTAVSQWLPIEAGGEGGAGNCPVTQL